MTKPVWILKILGYGEVLLDGVFPIEVGIHELNQHDCNKFKIEKFCAVLRNWNMDHYNKDYSTEEPKLLKFGYGPWLIKQQMYKNIPIRMDEYITLIDAFTCTGDKFGLKDIQVVVEVKISTTGTFRTWAEVYYIADAQIPSLIIEGRYISLYY